MASNYSDVLDQLRGFGLLVTSLQTTGRFVRCKVDGDREKRGWYCLHEIRVSTGDQLIVGSYGIWHGTALEMRNAVLIGAGIDRDTRRLSLLNLCQELRALSLVAA